MKIVASSYAFRWLPYCVISASLMFAGCNSSKSPPAAEKTQPATPPPGSKPKLPVSVKFEVSKDGENLEAHFQNNSDEFLLVKAEKHNPTLPGKNVEFLLDFRPRKPVVVDEYAFDSGDIITLQHDSYDTLTLKVP